jgi:hypothetical protein
MDAYRCGASCPFLEGEWADHQGAPAGCAERVRGEGWAYLVGEEVVGGQPFTVDDDPLWADQVGDRGEREPGGVPGPVERSARGRLTRAGHTHRFRHGEAGVADAVSYPCHDRLLRGDRFQAAAMFPCCRAFIAGRTRLGSGTPEFSHRDDVSGFAIISSVGHLLDLAVVAVQPDVGQIAEM